MASLNCSQRRSKKNNRLAQGRDVFYRNPIVQVHILAHGRRLLERYPLHFRMILHQSAQSSQVHDNAMDQAFRTRRRLLNDCVIGMTVFLLNTNAAKEAQGWRLVEDDLKYAVKDTRYASSGKCRPPILISECAVQSG
jgi:hypothetical protein